MGIFDNWAKDRELKRARKEMNGARSPYSVSQFVDKTVELDRVEEGLAEVEKAINEFPNSDCLQVAFRSLIKRRVEDEIQRYRAELRSGKAEGSTYYNLARLYKECGDYDQAIEFSRKGTRRFPEYEGNYIILGSIRYERFQRDLRAIDGQRAIELLEKASDLNRENYRLLKQLAEIYLAIGAKEMSINKLNDILNFAPDDNSALKLLGQAHKLKTTRKSAEIKEILLEFERRAELHAQMKSQGIGPRGQRYLRNPRELLEKLRGLERLEGFERVLVLTPQGDLLAAHPNDGQVKEYVTALRDCFEAALDCPLRMDISTFEKGLFESDRGMVYLLVFDRLQVALFLSAGIRREKLVAEVHRFLEHDLYL